MRLKKEVLRTRCKRPLHLAKFLNLSGLELVKLSRLEKCEILHWLIASDNKLQSDEGLENLKQLWYLDLSNNQLTLLSSLSRYLALGTLILTNNNLQWIELEKIRHAHLLSISLHGNPSLDSDPYYRIHVIDCLPLIWELDGRLVTVTERLHVKQFFIDTELSQHPIRHKMGKTFRTSAIRNIGTEGVVSRQCKYIYSKFPMSETHTKHTDERRLRYLTHMVQEDILQWAAELDKDDPNRPNVTGNFLDNFLEQRHKDVEGCNMVMLLLLISLEFQLPTALVRSVLTIAHLDFIGSVTTMPFFLLPPAHRTRVICVLLNAAKVDRDNNVQNNGGLYPQLFMCLYYTVAQLTRISQTSQSNMHLIKPIPPNSDYRALMASEVVSLMLQVPKYYSYLSSNDSGVVSLSVAATGDMEVIKQGQEKLEESENVFNVGLMKKTQKKVSEMIMDAIQNRLNKINIKMSDIPVGDRYLALSDSLPIKPLHSVIWACQFLSKGQTVPRLSPPILNPAREAAKPKPQQPKLGDSVLLGPQVVGELSMLLEGEIAMARIDAVPVSNGAVESKLKSSDAHYTFVDLKAMCFARDIGMWRPVKTTGDKYTIHSTDAKQMAALTESSTLKAEQQDQVQPLIYTPRTKTLMVYAPGALKDKDRPKSSAMAEKHLTYAVNRRAVSAGAANTNTHNIAHVITEKDLEEAFPEIEGGDIEEEGNNNRNDTSQQLHAITHPDTLHLHDNVHHIRGLTPREDSSRSVTLTLTPENTDRVVSSQIGVPVTSRSNSPALESVDASQRNGIAETEKKTEKDDKESELRKKDGNAEGQRPGDAAQETLAQDKAGHHDDGDGKAKLESDSGQGLSPHDHHRHDLGLEAGNGPSTCPVCLANAENTFLTAVKEQGEGLETVTVNPHMEEPAQGGADLASRVNTDLPDENTEPSFRNHPETMVRPKTSRPMGGVRMRVGDPKRHGGRPHSALDPGNIFTITHPPSVVATGPSIRLNDAFDGNGAFKTYFQQQREEAWKRTTRHRKPRPLTAIVQRSNSQFPPPQRPTSPTTSIHIKNPGLKITNTERWLGGGRDLYWEEVRRRPKSGHTPGWKEGLPESMKKQRPKSAFVSSLRIKESRPSTSMFVSSCSNCQGLEVSHPGYAFVGDTDDLDVTYIMPQSHQLMPQPHSSYSHRPHLSSPASEDGHDPLPLLGPETDNR